MRCASAGIVDVRADGGDLSVADENCSVLDRCAADGIDFSAGDRDRLRRCGRSGDCDRCDTRRKSAQDFRFHVSHRLFPDGVRYEAKLEIGAPLLARIEAVEEQRAVDPDLLGARVDAERIARPEHDVGVLAGLERADLVVEAERPGRVDRDPLDRVVLGDR